REVSTSGEKATRTAQRIVTDRNALAREFTRADLSPVFRENGTRNPGSPDYAAHAAERFANWRSVVDGMVAQPLAIGSAQILAAPQRTQITRHDCVEGWSAIGQWTGLPSGSSSRRAGSSGNAKYIVFHCADLYDGAPYYESIDS
ncbi:hypothetical protein OY671_012929, partial [Metschnikowia pulcherrima]